MVVLDRLKVDPVYNTRAVVQRTGVPADTFRAWERRYGIPNPTRTEGNHRLYSERDIALIRWLRERTDEGMTISQAIQLHRQEQGEVAPRSSTQQAMNDTGNGSVNAMAGHDAAGPASSPLARFVPEITDALVSFDAVTAEPVVEEALAIGGVESVCLHVLQPVLTEIGERWARGEVGISAEHYASHYVMRKIGTLFNLSRPEVGRGPIVAACVEGELHEVGLLLISLFLSRRGYSIVYLGANMPLDDLVQTVTNVDPPMILLSASTMTGARHLVEAARVLSDATSGNGRPGRTMTIGYGGSIFEIEPRLQGEITGMYLGADAQQAIAAVDRTMAGHRGQPGVPGAS